MTIHILVAVAEHEQEIISNRTQAALQVAKMRGTRLGLPASQEAIKALRAKTAEYHATVHP